MPAASMTDNVRTVLVALVVGATVLGIGVAGYWAEVRQAPITACQELDQELVADCLDGVTP